MKLNIDTVGFLLTVLFGIWFFYGFFRQDRAYKKLNVLMNGKKCRAKGKEYLIKFIGFYRGVSCREIKHGAVSVTRTRFKFDDIEVVYETDGQWRDNVRKTLRKVFMKKAVDSFAFLH